MIGFFFLIVFNTVEQYHTPLINSVSKYFSEHFDLLFARSLLFYYLRNGIQSFCFHGHFVPNSFVPKFDWVVSVWVGSYQNRWSIRTRPNRHSFEVIHAWAREQMSIVAHDKLVESGEKNKFLLCILMTPLKKKTNCCLGKGNCEIFDRMVYF